MKHAVWLFAFAALAQDPVELLEHVRDAGIADQLRLPKSCVETIDRSYFSRKSPPAVPPSCEQMAIDRKQGRYKLNLDATDRVRVAVRFVEDREIYSWTGTAPYAHGVEDILQFGPIGTGAFGTDWIDVFHNPAARFRVLRGQPAMVEYGFRIPIDSSHYSVGTRGGWRPAGYGGTVQIDRAALAVRRFTLETEELPPASLACEVDTAIEFPGGPSGDGWFLPRESRTHTIGTDTHETEYVTTLSACSDSLPPTAPPLRSPMRPGLTVHLVFDAAIDTDTAAAGDTISATLTDPVFTGNGITILPGAKVTGRIISMVHQRARNYFMIDVAFDTLVADGVSSPFYARLANPPQELPGGLHSMTLTGHGLKDWPHGMFLFPSTGERLVVKPPYRSLWVTAAPGDAK